ncbi:MAG: SPFH domain-containing protein, partial [Gammaproteobacteria bacterium]|nr:SPFH domain-containing protein [Gammaproteobacteria bacterium]
MAEIFDFAFSFWVGLAVLTIILIRSSVQFVEQNHAYIIERFGKYARTLEPGLNFLIPFIDKIAY